MKSDAEQVHLTVCQLPGCCRIHQRQQTVGSKTLFATHYHELTELEGKIDNVNNYCIAVKEKGDDIVFLRKIVKGGADKSYGIQVAKLAGVPDLVISCEGNRRGTQR